MTPQSIITTARYVLNDTGGSPRNTDAELLGYVNDGLRAAVGLRPDLFSTIGDLLCTPNQSEQALTFSDAARLIEVLCIHGGTGLTPFNITTMSAFNPGWRSDSPGVARQWARFPDDPLRFYVYPPAPSNPVQTLDVRYARLPNVYTMNEDITDLPETFQPALSDYVVYRAELKDDEHVLSQRGAAVYAQFVNGLKG